MDNGEVSDFARRMISRILRKELDDLKKEYDEEVISHDIEEKDLKEKNAALKIAVSNMNDTLTRTRAECTRLLEDNRRLTALGNRLADDNVEHRAEIRTLKALAKQLYDAVHKSPIRDLVNQLKSL